MISQYTWPNFHGGTDREGTKILVEEQGFSNDVKYGNTKIFVRSPQTLFALEQVTLEFWLMCSRKFKAAVC